MKANYIETEHGIFYDRIDDKGNLVETAKEYYERIKNKQIDICNENQPKSLEEQVQDLQKEKEQLWETVQFLLKKTGMIGGNQ